MITNQNERIELFETLITHYPQKADEIISLAEKELKVTTNFAKLSNEEQITQTINFIFEKDSIFELELKNILLAHNINKFMPEEIFNDFFENIKLINQDTFFDINSVNRKKPSIEKLNVLFSRLKRFLSDYRSLIKELSINKTNCTILLSDINSMTLSKDLKILFQNIEKKKNKLTEIEEKLKKTFTDFIEKYHLVEINIISINKESDIKKIVANYQCLKDNLAEKISNLEEYVLEDLENIDIFILDKIIQTKEVFGFFKIVKNARESLMELDATNTLINDFNDFEVKFLANYKKIIEKLKKDLKEHTIDINNLKDKLDESYLLLATNIIKVLQEK